MLKSTLKPYNTDKNAEPLEAFPGLLWIPKLYRLKLAKTSFSNKP